MKTIPLKQFTEELQRHGGRAVGGDAPVRVCDGEREFVVLDADALDAVQPNSARAMNAMNHARAAEVAEQSATAADEGRRAATMKTQLTGILWKEEDLYVALCPQLDVASQGETIESARANLAEALELYLECASEEEINEQMRDELYITQIEVSRA